MNYNPANWFWIGQPVGQSSTIIYSSATNAVVPANNPAYVEFLAGPGNFATPWPKDVTGAVTTAALDEVLTTANPPQLPTGLTPPTQALLLAYADGKANALMSVARTYVLAGSPAVSVKCDTMTSTGADLAGLNLWGAAAPTATTKWVDDFGVVTTITGAQGVALAIAVVAYGQTVFNELGTATTEITAGTITTTAQIDALAWPT